MSMQVLILLGIALTVTANAIYNNPDLCPHNLGKGTDHALVMKDCELKQVGGMGIGWVKKN